MFRNARMRAPTDGNFVHHELLHALQIILATRCIHVALHGCRVVSLGRHIHCKSFSSFIASRKLNIGNANCFTGVSPPCDHFGQSTSATSLRPCLLLRGEVWDKGDSNGYPGRWIRRPPCRELTLRLPFCRPLTLPTLQRGASSDEAPDHIITQVFVNTCNLAKDRCEL